ncbi:hypothetical protein QQ045_027277 [Rhodiola kirilowii]
MLFYSLLPTGCVPNTKRLNLQAAGVMLDKLGAVKVDEYSRTNIPSIWAVGTDIPPLSVVGFTEEEAVQQANGDVLIYTSSFNPMRNTISG